MSDDSHAPIDLSSSGIDLSQIFRPSWTVESSDSTARLAAKFDRGDRDERPDRQGGNRRREGQGQGGGSQRGSSRDREARSPRPQFGGGGRDAKSIPKTSGDSDAPQRSTGSTIASESPRRNRDEGRGRDSHDRRSEDRRQEPPQKPLLEGWNLTLIPSATAIEGIAKQIRSRAKAYPLFELARLIINLSDRYSVQLKAVSEATPELFRVKADGSLWSSRREAITHLLSKHLDKFYRATSITTEAPKGSYSVVAQCGMSGILLGPPNHHEYQSRLLALHTARFKNLPFEVYKTRIKMMRDEALMEQWKLEQSTSTVFLPIEQRSDTGFPSEQTQPSPEEVTTTAREASSSESPAEAVESQAESPTPEITQISSEENIEKGAETEEPLSETSAPISEDKGLTLEEATAHFHEHHADHEILPAGTEVQISGRVALHESDPLLHNLLIKTLQELDHFPLPLAQTIGKTLTSSGLQIYKAHKKIIHVSVARPRYLDRNTTPTSEGFRKILDYLEAHPNQQRDKQWAGLLAQITEPAGEDAEALQHREQALATDLLTLLHQGHVLDFAMGNLQAAQKPLPKGNPTEKSPETEKSPSQEAFQKEEEISLQGAEPKSSVLPVAEEIALPLPMPEISVQ